MKSIIIGAGPVGSYAASLLAKNKGMEVSLFEEHTAIGTPAHCTGIVTPEIFNFIPEKSKFILNKIYNVRIFAPNGSALKLGFKQPDIILDRVAFDEYLFNLACKAGACPSLKHRFLSQNKGAAKIKDLSSGKIKTVKFDKLIGADGPNSIIGRSTALINQREFFIGVQAVVKKKNDNILDFYPLPDGFGWSVPVDSQTLRVGVAVRKNSNVAFDSMLKRYSGRVLEKQGGLIPIYHPGASYSKGNIFLVGDAAGFVKATTGGGLVPGLGSSEALEEALSKEKNYRALLRPIRQKLWLNLRVRRLMDSFSEEEWNELVAGLNSEGTKSVFESINRDDIGRLAFSLLSKKPSLVKYGLRHAKEIFS